MRMQNVAAAVGMVTVLMMRCNAISSIDCISLYSRIYVTPPAPDISDCNVDNATMPH